jgi:pyruvate dehydrogenase E2 component (dihydrolipoamide acetyltransferase)
MSEVNMPRLSDTMQEGTLSRWLKKQGDEIKKGDILAEIETDKATMDLEAYDAGVLEEILVQEGETVPIGQVVARIGNGSETQKKDSPVATKSADKAGEAVAASVEGSQGESARAEGKGADTEGSNGKDAATEESDIQSKSTGREESDGSRLIKASPLARRIAEEHSIDLHQLQGTGPGGRIVRDDIEDFLEQREKTPASKAATAPEPATPAQEAPVHTAAPSIVPPDSRVAEVVPLSRVQALIARRLTESKQTTPHFYVSSEVDMTDALAIRQTLNASAGDEGVKVSVNDLVVKACALALEKYPEVNSSFKDGQFLRYKQIHVGIAVDVPSGLVVPVIHDANIKGVRAIARESKALIEKARTNKLSPSDLEGGTFSVSNLGMMDVTDFIAVINPPQAAILAVASTRKHFVPIDGQPVIRDLMPMTMSADHRIIYGATVARFLQEVKRLLQNPYNVLG